MQKDTTKINNQNATPKPAGDQTEVIKEEVEEDFPFACQLCGFKANCVMFRSTHQSRDSEVMIKASYSNWVASGLLSPIDGFISDTYSVIKELKDAKIKAIFNIQEEDKPLYSKYDPFEYSRSIPNKFLNSLDNFYKYDIQIYNLRLPDITTDTLLKTLKQMKRVLLDGHKIALNSHSQNGNIRLFVAAWEIYDNGMSAKGAIQMARQVKTLPYGDPDRQNYYRRSKWYKCQIVPQQYSYYGQAKLKEHVLYSLEKELRELRAIFRSKSKLKLEDYLLRQNKILPLTDGSEALFIPNTVLLCLKRMEGLMTSGNSSARDIALAFTSPNGENNSGALWNNSHERTLQSLKQQINTGKFKPYDIDDPRLLAQLVLDFFDQLASPAITSQFQVDGDDKEKLTSEKKDQFRSQMDKKEMHLIECFANFFSKLAQSDHTIVELVRKAILRLCISVLLERKSKNGLFQKRSMIKEQYTQDRVFHLHSFILKWTGV